jgi:hypothetical protein
MGTSVSKAGTDGARGMDTLGGSVGRAARTFDGLSAAHAAVGAAAATMAGFLSDAARAAADEEATFARLDAAVVATGASYEAYAEQIDAAIENGERLSFSDDQIADALARMTVTTGDAGVALNGLGVAMDFARARNIDLATASNLIGKALAGNTTALSRYGIVVAEGATATEVLAAIQQKVAGQAEAYADSTQGSIDRISNSFNNWIEGIGASTGPLQTLLGVLPGISAGYTLLGAALSPIGRVAMVARLGMGALALATNPLALGLGAVTLAGIEMYRRFQASSEATNNFEDAIDGLSATALDLRLSGLDSAALGLENFGLQLDDVSATSKQYLSDSDALRDRAIELGVTEMSLVDAYSRTAEEQTRVTDATVAITDAFDDQRINATALAADLTALHTQFENGQITADQYDAGLIAISENLLKYSNAAAEAVSVTEMLGTSLAQVGRQAGAAAAELAALFAEQAAATVDFANALGVLDTELEQMNFAGVGGDAVGMATAMTSASEALEAGFRVIVENTDAISKQSQEVADWADGLVSAAEGQSVLNQALQQGRITVDEHSAAITAQGQIHQANAQIQADVLAIQAKQAPLIADLTSRQAMYLESLREQPAAQQLVTLGFMDATEAAKAQNAVMLAGAAAAGELGKNGEAAATQIIQGAVQADPILKAMLLDMELINEGADGTITVNFGDAVSATAAIQDLTASVDALTVALGGVPPSVQVSIDVVGAEAAEQAINVLMPGLQNLDGAKARAEVSVVGANAAQDAVESIIPGLRNLDGSSATATVEVEDFASDVAQMAASNVRAVDGTTAHMQAIGVDLASQAAHSASGSFHAVNGQTSTLTAIGVNLASAVAQAAGGSFSAINGQTATLTAIGVDLASGAAASARGAIASVDGMVATSTINIVTNHITRFTTQGSPVGPRAFANGGIVQAALAEAGPELLHLAGGGMAVVPNRGVYGVPDGSYVTPAPQTRSLLAGGSGGLNVSVNVAGNVYGVDDLTNAVIEGVVPALTVAMNDVRAGQGVRR